MVFSQNTVSRPERYQDPHLEMDFMTASASLDSRPVILTRKEYFQTCRPRANAVETSRPRSPRAVKDGGREVENQTVTVTPNLLADLPTR
jgi:hypothetical protein